MPEYTGKQSILDAVLGDYRCEGFHLDECGDHFLLLYHQDGLLGTFNQSRVSISDIQDACREHLESLSAS